MHYNIFRNGMVLTFALSNAAQHGKRCNALIETSPWRISDFLVRNALPTASTGSSIHFHITDTNKGLEFQTSCGGTMPVGTDLAPDKAYGWQQCEDERVSFLYQQSNIQIRRSYVDDWYVSTFNDLLTILIT